MTRRHLRVLVAVADCGCSVTKAAMQLNLVQPAVSQAIAELERYYSVRLFERLNRRLFLTSAGQKLLDYARHLTGEFDTLDNIIKTTTGNIPLKIGATFTVSTVFLPLLLQKLSAEMVNVTVCNTGEAELDILESRLDAAIVEGQIMSGDIVQQPLIKDELVLTASPEYLPKEKLPENPIFILRERGSGTRERSDILLKNIYNTNNAGQQKALRIWDVANTQSIIALVKAGFGATVISRSLISKELLNGELVVLPLGKENTKICCRNFTLVYHKDKFFDERMNLFWKYCTALTENQK